MWSLFSILFVVIPAFAQAPATTSAPEGQPTASADHVQVAVPFDSQGPLAAALREIVEKFNARPTRSKSKAQVELVYKYDATTAAADAGIPDLALVNETDVSLLADRDAIQPLPAWWPSHWQFLLNMRSDARCDGKICSMPLQRSVPLFYVNKDLLAKKGISAIPGSWSKLRPLLGSLASEGIQAMALATSGDAAPASWSALGLTPYGGNHGRPPVPSTVDWVKKTLKTGNEWTGSIVPGRPDMSEAVRQFVDQKTVILVGEIWQLEQLQRDTKFALGTVLPAGTLGWLGTDLVLMKKPPQPKPKAKGIFEFLDYLYKADTALVLAKAISGLPVCRTYVEQAGWRKFMNASGGLINEALYRSPQTMALGKIPPENRAEWVAVTWNAIQGLELKPQAQPQAADASAVPASPAPTAPVAASPAKLSKEQQDERTAELKGILENLLRTKSP